MEKQGGQIMERHVNVDKLVIAYVGDSFLVECNKRLYSSEHISINVIDIMGDVYIMGFDDPLRYELYEQAKRVDIEYELDGSLYIEIFVRGY
jgi:hypothetical protein